MLFTNGFSKFFTDFYLGKQLSKLMNPKPNHTTVPRAILYFPITFTGKNSFALRNKITKLLREFYPQISVRVIFRPRQIMQNLFRLKDIVPNELQSSVVYKYECHRCNSVYVGKTSRQLRVRIFEHLGRSIRTNRPLSKPPFSAIRNHSHTCDHPINKESFSVLSTHSSSMELLVAEKLFITRDKPNLNTQEGTYDLLCF